MYKNKNDRDVSLSEDLNCGVGIFVDVEREFGSFAEKLRCSCRACWDLGFDISTGGGVWGLYCIVVWRSAGSLERVLLCTLVCPYIVDQIAICDLRRRKQNVAGRKVEFR